MKVSDMTLDEAQAWEEAQEFNDQEAPDDTPSDEDAFLEDLGVGGDGSAMTPSDEAWDGKPWDPDKGAGE